MVSKTEMLILSFYFILFNFCLLLLFIALIFNNIDGLHLIFRGNGETSRVRGYQRRMRFRSSTTMDPKHVFERQYSDGQALQQGNLKIWLLS